MTWSATERIKYCCRYCLSRVYLRLIQLRGGTGLDPLFDRQFYLEHYPDVARSGVDPTTHFLLYGAREFRQPHPLFDTAYYLAANPDVAAAGLNPLLQFLQKGWREGRRPNPLFDPAWYAARYGLDKDVNPLLDYARRRAARESVLPRPPLREFLLEPAPAFNVPALANRIDVIVPVSLGMPETKACLESLAGTRARNCFDVVLVEYGTPDPQLARHVRTIAKQRGWTLLENAGETRALSIQLAAAIHPVSDVVLLSSDAVVSSDWLDRLAAAAYSAPQIGTATPFSISGMICGYPDGAGDDDLDRVFCEVNGGRTVALPQPSGFCTYIRREYLRAAASFERAAGPQPRACDGDTLLPSALLSPCQHVLAAGVFVGRRHGVASLRTDDKGSGARTDPAIFHRFAVSAARLKRCGRPVILAISHSLGGGVAEYLRRLNKTLLGQAEFLLLIPSGHLVILESMNPEFAFSLAVDPKDDYEGLLEALRQCCVTRLHIQHVLGHVLDIHQLCNDLGVPFDFTVHDYLTICPQVHLNDVNGRYCGEPSEAGCNRCLSARPVYRSQSIGQWRRDHAWLLRDASRVIVPSLDTELRMEKYSPGLRMIAAAHPEPGGSTQMRDSPPVRDSEPLRIVILGVLSRQKGLALVSECTRIAQQRRLPLEFTLIGHVGKTSGSDPQPFRQTGPYDNTDLPDLLAAANPHLVWFPSQVPETHSFTLGSALYAGLPVAVPALGAMPERLTGLKWAWIIPVGWEAKRMIAFFLSIREKNFIPHVAPQPPQGPTPVRHGFYETEYLRPTKTASFGSGLHG